MKGILILRFVLTGIVVLFPLVYGSIFGFKNFSKLYKFCKRKYETIIALGSMQKQRVHKHVTKAKKQIQEHKEETQENESMPSAIETVTKASPKKEKKETSKTTRNLIDKIMHQAMAYKEKGQFDMYEKKLIEGLAIDADNIDFRKKLADRYFHANNHKKSLTLLKQVIETSPQDHEALRQMGEIYLEQGEFDTAEIFIEKAIKIAADRPKYYISLVEVKYNTNRIEEAIELVKKAIALRPGNVGYLVAIAGLYEEINDIQHAKKYYFEVLELDPTNSKARKKVNNL